MQLDCAGWREGNPFVTYGHAATTDNPDSSREDRGLGLCAGLVAGPAVVLREKKKKKSAER